MLRRDVATDCRNIFVNLEATFHRHCCPFRESFNHQAGSIRYVLMVT
jgi:hypothetical protein